MTRKTIAAAILLLWMGGFAWMLRRNSGGDQNRRLTEAALRVQPATFYYTVSYRGRKIGAASSAIDTLVAALVSEEYYTGTFPLGDSLVPVSARLRSRLSRAFRLTNISVELIRSGQASKMNALVQSDTTLVVTTTAGPDSAASHILGLSGPLLTPGLVGVALMLGEEPRVGRGNRFAVFNPVDAKAERREVQIGSDSLFTLPDSALQGSDGRWTEAHSDTVRAWQLKGDTNGLTVWLDREGRVVAAGAPNGLAVVRTAFELAFDAGRKQ